MTLLILKFPTMRALLLVLTVIVTINLEAQNLIAVQNGDQPEFYYSMDSAIYFAQIGDSILLPGGTWFVTVPINKELHIIGVGAHPDSSSATFTSSLSASEGQFKLMTGADNGSITGIRFNAWISVVTPVEHFTISRCNLTTVRLCSSSTEFDFYENIFQTGMSQPYSAVVNNCTFYNNIFNLGFSFYDAWNYIIVYKNCILKNNIFLSSYNAPWYPIITQYSVIENNIFLGTGSMLQVKNSLIKNNLFSEDVYFDQSLNSWSNNINNYTGTIFINQSGNSFDYSQNYHLASNCPGNNAGTDGTDIGIFGGIFPWKEGSIPQNPHIKFKNISGATDPNGNINVIIRVAAQDN